MSDLISRQALCEYALNQKDKSVTPNDIMRFPSAQESCKQVTGKLIERKTGEWIDREHCQVDEDGYDIAFCSVCGEEVTLAPWGDAFCPCCGSYNGG